MAKRKKQTNLENYFSPMGWYPKANAADHYVFLNTLENDNPGLKNAAEALLKVNGNSADFSSEAHFLEAITFLKMAANSERQKEINFLRSKGLDVPPNINFIDLIREISEAILSVEEFERRIKEEIKRRGKKGTGAYSYTQGLGGYISAALNQLNSKGRTKNTLSAIVRTELIKGTKSLSGKLNLNEIAAVIGATQSQIMGVLQEEIDKDVDKTKYYNKNGKLSVTKVGELIKNNSLFQENFGKNAQKSVEEFQMIANNILSKYHRVLSPAAEKAIRSELPHLDFEDPQIEKKLTQMSSRALQDMTGLEAEELYSYSFKKNTGMGGEARVYQDLQGMITKWIGGAGGKTDILSYTIGEVEVAEKKYQKQFGPVIQKVIENITAKTQSEFEKTNKNIAQAYEEIEKVMQKISKELGELKQAFIIHNNVKDYYSTATSDFNGFHGGTSPGLSIIEAISALSEAGFPAGEINLLKTCAVNTANAAVGASNKESLEKYLSIFATMLLFDDGVTIAQEVAKNFNFTNLNVLHLFPVNGIYVPSSYVMSTVASSLEAWLSNNSGPRSAASVIISPGSVDFSQKLIDLTEAEIFGVPRWQAIRDEQIAAMSARIKFLANFKVILDNLTS